MSYPVYQDDAPLFEAVALFCIHHGILRGCSSHFENECIFHRAESERQESRGALLQMETFLRLAVKKERWNVVRCLSGLQTWPNLLLFSGAEIPCPLLAMCLFYSWAASDGSVSSSHLCFFLNIHSKEFAWNGNKGSQQNFTNLSKARLLQKTAAAGNPGTAQVERVGVFHILPCAKLSQQHHGVARPRCCRGEYCQTARSAVL